MKKYHNCNEIILCLYVFFISPVIVSCSGSMRYDPDQLPSAKFGEKYNIQVQLKGGGSFEIGFIIQFSHILLVCTRQKRLFL